jgi:hypothetical protein
MDEENPRCGNQHLCAASRRARQTFKPKIWRHAPVPDTITLQQVHGFHPSCLPVERMTYARVQLKTRAAGRYAKPSPAEMDRGHRELSSTDVGGRGAVVVCRIQCSARMAAMSRLTGDAQPNLRSFEHC